MKFIYTIAFLFFSFVNLYACRCVHDNFSQAYLDSEIVALVSIQKTYGDEEIEKNGMQMRMYQADLKFEKIYKGKEFKTLNIFGTTKHASSGACEKLVEKGEKYLIAISQGNDGRYIISSCSKVRQINSDIKYLEKIEETFEILEKNKSKFGENVFADYYDNSENYNVKNKTATTDFSNLELKNAKRLGIYKVSFDDEGKLIDIFEIDKIGKREKEIQKLMKKNLIIEPAFGSPKGDYLILLEL